MTNTDNKRTPTAPLGGLAGWLLGRLRSASRPQPRLAVVERITLAPRQSLALVEVEGRRLLIATSPDGSPAFYALDDRANGRSAARASMLPVTPLQSKPARRA
jgi:flagellar biogenesis protein FliO